MTNKIEAIMADVEKHPNRITISQPGYMLQAITLGDLREILTKHLQPESEDGWGPWIDWGGGECPVRHDTLVITEWSDKDIVGPVAAGNVGWRHDAWIANIIRYRIKKQD